MKAIELLRIGTCLLSVMSENGLMRDDYRFLGAYDDFQNMRRNRVKYRAAIRILSQEMNVSERTLERTFKRLSKEI